MGTAPLTEPTPRGGARPLLRWAALGLVSIGLLGIALHLSLRDPATGGSVPGPPSRAMAPAVERSPQPQPHPTTEPTPLPPPTSGRIVIPAIGVNARLVPLERMPDGSLEVPSEWHEAGWYVGGPFPGEPGPAVVAGHVDSNSGPAVFYRLRELRRGDIVIVLAKGRERARLRVVSSTWFPKSDFPTRRVYGPVSGPALRLVTCGGVFDDSTGHYLDNLVVFAVPAV